MDKITLITGIMLGFLLLHWLAAALFWRMVAAILRDLRSRQGAGRRPKCHLVMEWPKGRLEMRLEAVNSPRPEGRGLRRVLAQGQPGAGTDSSSVRDITLSGADFR
jgi:hypothetical protein